MAGAGPCPVCIRRATNVPAAMALEAGLFRSQPVPARPEFAQFANHVDATHAQIIPAATL